MQTWAILLAAGQGTRLGHATGGVAKQFLQLDGEPLYWRSAVVLHACARLRGLVFVFPPDSPDQLEAEQARLLTLTRQHHFGLPWKICAGGARRQDSVAQGLATLPADCDTVLIHDAARPFVTAALCNRVLDALAGGASGVTPGVPVTDTIKLVDVNDCVCSTPDRHLLRAVQTPQGFALSTLRAVHAEAQSHSWTVTDDAGLLERCHVPVLVVPGDAGNRKITTSEDLAMLMPQQPNNLLPCVGYGYDVHKFAMPPCTHNAPADAPCEPLSSSAAQPGRPLRLGGVPIPNAPQVLAHSDGDVLLHALADALLGCLGRGDIGQLFPDTDPAYDNMDSAVLLDEVLGMARMAGLRVTHVDITLVAQVPKVGPHREAIRKNVARLMALPLTCVNIKATTEEGLGFTGEKKGIKAVALVTGLCGGH